MAKFCTQCGKELDENGLCPVCNQTANTGTQTNYSPAAISLPANNDTLSAWTVFALMILFTLPFIGFISVIIFSIVPSGKNLKNFARGYLLYTIAITLIAVICFIGFAGLVATVIGNTDGLTNEVTNGDYSSLEDALNAIEEQYGFEFGNVLGKLKT